MRSRVPQHRKPSGIRGARTRRLSGLAAGESYADSNILRGLGARVGVGIVIAHDPLHGSGRADFPHPALTSGNDAHAAQWIRMIYACGRQPTVDQASHSVPTDVASLAAARERSMPEQARPQSERAQSGVVHGHSVIADVSTNDRPQPLAYFRDGVVHASSEFVFYLAQLRLHPLTNRLPQHRVVTVASRLPA